MQPTHAFGDWPLPAMKCGFGRDLVIAAAAVQGDLQYSEVRVHIDQLAG
jgi:hypothetical protein